MLRKQPAASAPDPNDGKEHLRGWLASEGIPFIRADYARGAVLFRQGDSCRHVMHIESGDVRLSITSRSGREAICDLLGLGAFVGDEVLGGLSFRRHTATAMTDTKALLIAKAQMLRAIRTHRGIADQLVPSLVSRHARLEMALAAQIIHSAEQRLLAKMVGTTRSRVDLLMGKFKRLGSPFFTTSTPAVGVSRIARPAVRGHQARRWSDLRHRASGSGRLAAWRSVSDGRSPNRSRYAPAKRPSSKNPCSVAASVTAPRTARCDWSARRTSSSPLRSRYCLGLSPWTSWNALRKVRSLTPAARHKSAMSGRAPANSPAAASARRTTCGCEKHGMSPT
jgi:CRP/FNR family transcriptional regulator, cyclic AMP receptor protein